jgi:hypothetical protein
VAEWLVGLHLFRVRESAVSNLQPEANYHEILPCFLLSLITNDSRAILSPVHTQRYVYIIRLVESDKSYQVRRRVWTSKLTSCMNGMRLDGKSKEWAREHQFPRIGTTRRNVVDSSTSIWDNFTQYLLGHDSCELQVLIASPSCKEP